MFECLSEPTLELRCGAIEAIREAAGMARVDVTGALGWPLQIPSEPLPQISGLDYRQAIARLTSRIGEEQYPPVLSCVLATLTELCERVNPSEEIDLFNALGEKWEFLASFCCADGEVVDTDVSAAAIQLLGYIARTQIARRDQWFEIIEQSTAAHHPAFIREAAVRSIAYSNVLHDTSSSAHSALVWFLVVHLIQVKYRLYDMLS